MCGPGQPPSATSMPAGPGESQGAAGIVTAILTALVGSDLPGPGSSIRIDLGADQGRAADRRDDDRAARRAGEAAGSGDRRARRPVHRPGGSGRRDSDPGGAGADDAAAAPAAGASAGWVDRALQGPQADADRRGAPVQRRCAGRRGRGRRGRADRAGAIRSGSRDPPDRRRCPPGHRHVPDRGLPRARGLGA